MKAGTLAIRIGGLLLVILLGWRAVGSGLADYYVAQDSPFMKMKALNWRERQPQALYMDAGFQVFRDPTGAAQSLRKAAWANPADALVYLALAEVWAAAGRQAAAVRLVEIADELAPMRSIALMRSAIFWLKQNQLDRALRRQSVLLSTRPAASAQIFPKWLQLIEEPTTRPLLAVVLANSPEWWSRFFSYVANNAQKTETVTFLYRNRWGDGNRVAAVDQKIYLDRLWRDQNWPEAYRVWRNGLNEESREALDKDGIYNARFELPLTGVGFDWRVTPLHGVTVETTETYGVRSGKALHIAFDGQRVRFQHIRQYLYLDPGHYQLRGRVRPDSLRTERGLRWVLRCNSSQAQQPLAESERFLGVDEWRTFVVDFTVPQTDDCRTQWLRLELEGRAELDFEVAGGVWFDDLTINRVE